MQAGDTFAQLTVLQVLPPRPGGKNGWIRVSCTCGTVKEIARHSWEEVKSCGCTRYTNGHGRSGSQEHRAWTAMRSRCRNPKDAAYSDYGARGIAVDPRWESFDQFLKDMGSKPTRKHRLDRIDVNQGYSKNNCRWVDPQESNLNRRGALKLLWMGEQHYLIDVAALYGVPYSTAKGRLHRGQPIIKD